MTTPVDFQAECEDRDFSKLLTMAKDHESMCDRLLSTTRSFEGQLRALRSEHEALKAEAQALRRCLHKSGVLQAGAIEQELLETCTNSSSGIESVASTMAASFASNITGAASSSDGGSTGGGDCNANGSAPVRLGVQFSGQCTGDSDTHGNESMHCRGRSAEKSGEEIPRNRGLVDRWRSRSSGAGGCSRSRSRSSSNSRDKKQNPMSSPLRQRPAKQAGAEEADSRRSSPKRDSSGDEEDLYEICKPLLDKDAGMLEQQQAYRRVARVLSGMRAVPRTWRGPGTPLSEAVRSGRVDFARLLLQAGVEVNDRDDKGVGALHIATFDGDIDLCRVLLAARAEVDLQDCVGQTPLFFAPTRRICRLLVEQFADVSALNFKGQTALHLAGRAGLHDVLSWLAQRTCKSVVEHKDIYGATAYYYLQHGVEGVPRERTRSGAKPLSPVPVRSDSSKGSPPSPPHTGSFSGAGPAGREDRKSSDRWRKNEQGLLLESSGNNHGDAEIVPAVGNRSSMGKLKVKNGLSQSARTLSLRSDSPQKNGLLPMSARTHKAASLLGSKGGVINTRQASGLTVPRGLATGGRATAGPFDPRHGWGAGGSPPRRALGNGASAKGLNGQMSSLSAFAASKSSGGPASALSGFGGTNFPQGKVLRGRGGGRGLMAKASSREGKRVHRPSLSGVAEADEEDERDEDEHISANARHQASSSPQQSQSTPNLATCAGDAVHERPNEEASMATAMEAAAAVATAAVATAAELERASSSPESPASEATAPEAAAPAAEGATAGEQAKATAARFEDAVPDEDPEYLYTNPSIDHHGDDVEEAPSDNQVELDDSF